MITAGIGAILGTVLGIVFALVVSRPLAEQGFVFMLPIVMADRVLRAGGDRGRGGGDPARAAGVEGRRAAGGDDRVGR